MGSRLLVVLLFFEFVSMAMPVPDFEAGLKAYQAHDYETAVKEWRPLAEKGNRSAQFNLGLMYLDGQGVPQDYAQAADWFRKSADLGFAKAQYNLGELYATGQGVKKDYVQAHMWLNLCAASGNATCAAHRDLLAKKMKPAAVAEAQHRAVEWKAKILAQPDDNPETNPDASPKE